MAQSPPFASSVANALWTIDTAPMPRWKAGIVHALRILYVVVRDVVQGTLTLHATSLVYTTLLSLVPLLAISFALLKAFGVHNQVEPVLLNLLAPLGEQKTEITDRIIEFVERMQVGVLGAMGLGLLVYTVISMMQKIEGALNEIWRVTQERPLSRKFSDYLSVIVVGPVLMFSALGITASITTTSVVRKLTAIEPFGLAIQIGGRMAPYVLIAVALTFLYTFLPNTKVRLRSALTGGIAAGVLWATAGWLFAAFIATSTNYKAIYSAFAAIILFMIWLYVSWVIVLVGGSIAFYHQHPEYVALRRQATRLSNRMKERLAFLAIVVIARAYYRGDPPWTLDGLADKLRVPDEVLCDVIEALEKSGLLMRTADDPPRYLPARPLEMMQAQAALDAIRRAEERKHFDVHRLPSHPSVDAMMARIDRAANEVLQGCTLKQLALNEAVDESASAAALGCQPSEETSRSADAV